MATGQHRTQASEVNPTPEAEEEDHTKDKGKFIKFTGHNGVRKISKDDWKAIKVTDQDDAQWDKTNAWRLPHKDFSDKALNYLLNVDGEFVAED